MEDWALSKATSFRNLTHTNSQQQQKRGQLTFKQIFRATAENSAFTAVSKIEFKMWLIFHNIYNSFKEMLECKIKKKKQEENKAGSNFQCNRRQQPHKIDTRRHDTLIVYMHSHNSPPTALM